MNKLIAQNDIFIRICSKLFDTLIVSLKKATFFDFIFYFFTLCLARQYMWIIPNQVIAWCLSIILGLFFWAVYQIARVYFLPYESKTDYWFYLLFIPALIYFILMTALPEVSYDTLNLRLFYQKEGLMHFPFSPDGFAKMAGNILPEMINALFVFFLGWRMGLLVNFILIVWTVFEIKEILSKYIKDTMLLLLSLVFITYTATYTVLGLHTYFTDFYAIPVIILCFRLIIDSDKNENIYKLIFLCILLGITFALKYSNFAFIVPIGLVGLYNQRLLIIKKPYILLYLVSFFIPLLPFSIYCWLYFRNPLFNFANSIFNSPYWPKSNPKDLRWGPENNNMYQILIWPYKILFNNRFSETEGIYKYYDGRLSFGYIISLLSLPFSLYYKRSDLLKIQFVIIVGAILWTASSGYSRYMLPLEYISVIFLFLLLATIKKNNPISSFYAVIILCSFCFTSFVAVKTYTSPKYVNWNSRRHSDLNTLFAIKNQYNFFLKDRNIRSFIPDNDLKKFDEVQNWASVGYAFSLGQVISPKKTITTFGYGANIDEYLGKEFSSFILHDGLLDSFISFINNCKYRILSVQRLNLPFFSDTVVYQSYLITFLLSETQTKYSKSMILADYLEPVISGEILQNNSEKLLFFGFNQSEIFHRWSWEKTVSIDFVVDNISEFQGRIDISFATYNEQSMKILLNGTEIFFMPKQSFNDSLQVDFDISLLKQGINILSFELPDAGNAKNTSPFLGFSLRSMVLK